MTARASDDLAELASYVLARAPHRGAQWLLGFENAIAKLAELPEAYPLATESPGARGEEIRQLLYGDKPSAYRILFTINSVKRSVFVLTIRHGRRLPATGL